MITSVSPFIGDCHKAKGNRKIHFNWKFKKHKDKAKEKLMSEQGVAHRSQRHIDVAAVFLYFISIMIYYI